MSLVHEIESIKMEDTTGLPFYEESGLIKQYQDMLDKGLIKKRGYTLQTIEEKQRDIPEVKIVYNV